MSMTIGSGTPKPEKTKMSLWCKIELHRYDVKSNPKEREETYACRNCVKEIVVPICKCKLEHCK